MRRLHVAVIVKSTANYDARECRNMGHWSYAVDEFSWDFIPLGKGKVIDTVDYKARGYDLIFVEDGGSYPDFRGDAIPNVFYSIDSTLSDKHHYLPRLEQARKADLVLVDHDQLERFEPCGKPVRRFLYAVNDHLFYPREKSIDVNFQCGGGSPERAAMRVKLNAICKAHGWSYRSGTAPLAEYAENMGRSKVVVVIPRTPTNRPHRLRDAQSCGASILSASLPDVSGEVLREGIDYYPLESHRSIEEWLTELVGFDGCWETQAAHNQQVSQAHTWTARSRELRLLLSQELGI